MSAEPVVMPVVVDVVTVAAAQRLSPSFVRVELVGECMADFGVEGPYLDQRIKLIFPSAQGLPPISRTPEWYARWRELPEEQQGAMRTYTVSDVVGEGSDARLIVDIVVHEAGPSGPGGDWALTAKPGDQLILAGPRKGYAWGGIEFDPGQARRLLLVGDETAVPAVLGILRDLSADAEGHAFLEIPDAADEFEVVKPDGVAVTWLPRAGLAPGSLLHSAVVAHLAAASPTGQRAAVGGTPAGGAAVDDEEVDPALWETPGYSSSGEAVEVGARPMGEFYAWIAGEAAMVTGLRRHLVKELGIDRRQVAFMGYWRLGRAMSGG